MVGGGNENGYGRQCGIPVALIGNKSGKAQRGADKAPRSIMMNDEDVSALVRAAPHQGSPPWHTLAVGSLIERCGHASMRLADCRC
jgi:hypothetical protein